MKTLLDDYFELRQALGLPTSLTHAEAVSHARMMWETLTRQDVAITNMNALLRDMACTFGIACGEEVGHSEEIKQIEVKNG